LILAIREPILRSKNLDVVEVLTVQRTISISPSFDGGLGIRRLDD
jgi:hypothetical protein